MKKIIILLLILSSSWYQGCAGGNEMIVKKLPVTEPPSVSVYKTAIGIPLGYFSIVQRGAAYCAIKFSETGRNEEKEYRYAIYEWYYQGNGSGDFSRSDVKHGTGRATYHYVPIIGMMAFQTGNVDVACGEMHIKWYGDTTLTFEDARKDETEEETIKAGVKIAPTKWTDITQVNVFDKRLKWYRYDAQREKIEIPAEQLW